MNKPVATIEHTSKVKGLNDALKRLKKTSILVGIPRGSEKDRRKDSKLLNSELGYIHEKGSPAAGIPARPFLEPGVRSVKDQVAEQMGKAMDAAIKGDERKMDACLETTAQKALSAVQNYLAEGHGPPLKPATIKNRSRSRGTDSKREGEAEGTAEVTPLINSRALLGALEATVHKE